MTPAAALIAEAAEAGVRIYRAGDRLRLRAPGPPDDDLRRRIREAAADLLPLVPPLPPNSTTSADPALRWRIEAMRRQLPPYSRPMPLLLARPEVRYQPGRCLSCGDPVPAPRCEPCKMAVQFLLDERQATPGGPLG